ncbi:MAG: nucleoside deaminase [Alphaproteobacteria bacterium]|nr:nucleoside deaminase [Alphaproteobacteria bacterium]
MDLALEEARRAAALGEVPVGAVLVRDGEVLAADGNRTLERSDPTAHAEVLVLRAACAAAESQRLPGCDLYVTLEPCPMCAAAIPSPACAASISAPAIPKGGAVEHGVRFYAQPTCHHAPEVYSGLAERDAATLLRDFFRTRRD